MEGTLFDFYKYIFCIFAASSLQDVHYCEVMFRGDQYPDACPRSIAYRTNENHTPKRLDLDLRLDSRHSDTWENDFEYYQFMIKDLAHSIKIVDSIAAPKVYPFWNRRRCNR